MKTLRASCATLLACIALACGAQSGTHAKTPKVDIHESTQGTLRLRNESVYAVCYVYASVLAAGDVPNPSDRTDRLGFDDFVRPRDERKLKLAPGSYRIELEDCDGNPLYRVEPLQITGGVTVVEFRGQASH